MEHSQWKSQEWWHSWSPNIYLPMLPGSLFLVGKIAWEWGYYYLPGMDCSLQLYNPNLDVIFSSCARPYSHPVDTWADSDCIHQLALSVGQDHVHHHFVWRNAKSFYCFSLWEKASLHFQCILKSILHETTLNELLVSHHTLLYAYTKQLCIWPCNPPVTENISECKLCYRTQVLSIR